jgi:3-hydroxyisobutyrate dehydrogenase-like beta-hydroxyacid dehydrogenase
MVTDSTTSQQQSGSVVCDTRRVGFAGTGLMGQPMAARLLEHGHQIVAWNRTTEKVEVLVREHGAQRAATPAELADCDVVIVMLLAADHVRELLFGPDGVLSSDKVPRVVVNMSTIEVPAAEEIRSRCAARGVSYLAGPVSGSTVYAQEGRLTIVASGPPDTVEAVRPLLEVLGSRLLVVGEGVEANLVKLAINMVIGATNSALAEAMALIVRGGVSEPAYLEALDASVITSPWLQYKIKQLIEHDYTPGHTVRGLDKDYGLMAATAAALQVPLPVTSLVHQQIRTSIGHGDGDADMTALVRQAFRAAGLPT